jgi:hypothetical protein
VERWETIKSNWQNGKSIASKPWEEANPRLYNMIKMCKVHYLLFQDNYRHWIEKSKQSGTHICRCCRGNIPPLNWLGKIMIPHQAPLKDRGLAVVDYKAPVCLKCLIELKKEPVLETPVGSTLTVRKELIREPIQKCDINNKLLWFIQENKMVNFERQVRKDLKNELCKHKSPNKVDNKQSDCNRGAKKLNKKQIERISKTLRKRRFL